MGASDTASEKPLFTSDDHQLVSEAARRESERLRMYCELRGVVIEPDDQIPRLRDLAERLRLYVRSQAQGE